MTPGKIMLIFGAFCTIFVAVLPNFIWLVCSVLGNHDFLIYERRFKSEGERTAVVDRLAGYELDTLGWRLLRNESVKIEKGGEAITVIGVDNRNCSDQGFKTISGHTHAAQVRLFGWTPASIMFSRAYGLYEESGQTIYVNPGLGCTAPFRIGARPEITVITLKSTL